HPAGAPGAGRAGRLPRRARGGAASRSSRVTTSVPILMWHHIGAAPTKAMAPYATPPERFHEQLDALLGAGFQAVTFDDLRKGTPVERPVVLTFDDGYTSFAELASPALV